MNKGIVGFLGSVAIGLVAGFGLQSYHINKLQMSIDSTEQQLKDARAELKRDRDELIAMTDMSGYIPEGFDKFLEECEEFLEKEL